jgi:hypothetical protein
VTGPVWADLRQGGAGSWRHTAPHASTVRLTVTTFLACLIGTTLFLGLVVAGRAAMCATHSNKLSYCPGYVGTPR